VTTPASAAFADSLIATFPGTGFAWALVVALAVSLIRGEFLPSRGKPVLLGTLAASLLLLGALLLGQSMIAAHDSVAQLFSYAAGTIVTMGAVIWLSPAGRPDGRPDTVAEGGGPTVEHR
jgi:hypothetical protein